MAKKPVERYQLRRLELWEVYAMVDLLRANGFWVSFEPENAPEGMPTTGPIEA